MTRLLVTLHRWIGVVLCLLFATWFATGVVMIYVPFPSLAKSERIERAAVVDASNVTSMYRALDAAGVRSADRIRLIDHSGQPILVVEESNGDVAAIFTDSGATVPALTSEDAHDIAMRFADVPVRSVAGPLEHDQWIVHQQFDGYRPFYRVGLADSVGTNLYVSQVSGEVLQRTNRSERLWNYVGAIVHWIYPTFIRKHWALWDQLVWWLSLVGLIGVVLGFVLGIQHLQKSWRRGRRGLASPFAGWMALHHKLGLLFGGIVAVWIFSGWLSMDHGRLFSVPDPTQMQVERFRGISIAEAMSRIPVSVVDRFSNAREIEFSAVAGQTVVVARQSTGTEVIIVNSHGELTNELALTDVEAAIRAAWPGHDVIESYLVPPGDRYTDLREGSLGPDILRSVLADDRSTWIHVDMKAGRIASVMDRSRRTYRWLFNGLHSLDIPGLVNTRPLWDVLIIILMLGGFAFSVTGAVIGYRRLSQSLRTR